MITLLTQKRKGDIEQIEQQTPETIIRTLIDIDSSHYCYIDTTGGSCDSINRLKNRNCVIAYYKFDRLCYMLIQNTSKQLRLYRLFHYDTYTYRHCRIAGEQVKNRYSDILKLDFKILNEDLFKQFKQQIMLDELSK
jgi:hypothetical protein